MVFNTDKCKEIRISFSNLNSQGAPGYDNVMIHSKSVNPSRIVFLIIDCNLIT